MTQIGVPIGNMVRTVAVSTGFVLCGTGWDHLTIEGAVVRGELIVHAGYGGFIAMRLIGVGADIDVQGDVTVYTGTIED